MHPQDPQDGFAPEHTIYTLSFTGHPDFDGMVVRLGHMTLGERLAFDEMRLTPPTSLQEKLVKERAIAAALAKHLLSWNLRDPDTRQPVPATLEGIWSQEDKVIGPIVRAWVDALIGVRRPLEPTPPPPGGTDEDEEMRNLMTSIPVAPLGG